MTKQVNTSEQPKENDNQQREYISESKKKTPGNHPFANLRDMLSKKQ